MRMTAKGRAEYFLAKADSALKWQGNKLYDYWSKVISEALRNDKNEACLEIRGTGVTMSDAYEAIGLLVTVGFYVHRQIDAEGHLLYLVEW